MFDLNLLMLNETSRYHPRFLFRNYNRRHLLDLSGDWRGLTIAGIEEVYKAHSFDSISQIMLSLELNFIVYCCCRHEGFNGLSRFFSPFWFIGQDAATFLLFFPAFLGIAAEASIPVSVGLVYFFCSLSVSVSLSCVRNNSWANHHFRGHPVL